MTRMRLSAIAALAFLTFACGGSGSPSSPTATTPTPTPTPTPSQTTIAMDGVVGETAPTTATRVPNPTLRIVDGPSAGTATQGDSNGYYLFGSLAAGTFRVEVSAQDYESNTFTVTRNSSGPMPFNLRPVARILDQVFQDAISGGDARCQTTLGQQPCKTFNIGVHHDGQLDAELRWSNRDNDLDLDLYQDGTRIATSGGVVTTQERITTTVRAGLAYQLRVYYWRGATIEHFTLTVRRPS